MIKSKKGLIGAAFLVVASVLVVYGLLSWMGSQKEATDLQIRKTQLEIEQLAQQQKNVVVVDSSTTGLYSYDGVVPYVNFLFDDGSGNAVNPTLYLYDKDPTTLTGGENWGLERSWTDRSTDYKKSGTASSGKLQLQLTPGKTYWGHASLSSYKDVFLQYTVPLKGDVSPEGAVDTNAGLSAYVMVDGKEDTFHMPAYDTTVLTASIDLGADGSNHTNTEHIKVLTTNVVTDNKEVCLDQIKLTQVKKYDDVGIRKIELVINGQVLSVYDYTGSYDKTKYVDSTNLQVYDSNDYSDHRAFIKTVCWTQRQTPDLKLDIYADERDTTSWAAKYLANGNTTFVMYAYDREGTAIINGVSVTA